MKSYFHDYLSELIYMAQWLSDCYNFVFLLCHEKLLWIGWDLIKSSDIDFKSWQLNYEKIKLRAVDIWIKIDVLIGTATIKNSIQFPPSRGQKGLK